VQQIAVCHVQLDRIDAAAIGASRGRDKRVAAKAPRASSHLPVAG
jgi:hypothetical protein